MLKQQSERLIPGPGSKQELLLKFWDCQQGRPVDSYPVLSRMFKQLRLGCCHCFRAGCNVPWQVDLGTLYMFSTIYIPGIQLNSAEICGLTCRGRWS